MSLAIGNKKLGFTDSSTSDFFHESINLILTEYLNIEQDYFYLDKNVAINIISSFEEELDARLTLVENSDNYEQRANANTPIKKYVYMEYYVKSKSKNIVIYRLKPSQDIIRQLDFFLLLFKDSFEYPDTFRLYFLPKWFETEITIEYTAFMKAVKLNPLVQLDTIDDRILGELLKFNLVEWQNGGLYITHKYNVLFRWYEGYGGPQGTFPVVSDFS